MKDFLKSLKGKLCIAGAVLLLAGAALGGYTLWRYLQPDFQDVTIELGVPSLGVEDFATEYASLEDSWFAGDVSTLDIGKAGIYPVTLRQGSREQTVLLTVVDTTPPAVTFLEELRKGSDYEPKPEDFVENCYDLSGVTVAFEKEPEEAKDLSDRSFTVVVTDGNGNAVRKECTLTYAWLKESVRHEFGTPLTKADVLLDPERDNALVAQALLDTINSNGVGEYTIRSRSGNAKSECHVVVEDTTGPALELQTLSIYVGRTAEAEDFIVSAEDPSGVKEVRLVTEPDFQIQGPQTLVFEAEDTWGNLTTQETTLYIVTDLEPPVIGGLTTLRIEKNSTGNYLSGVTATDKVDGACEVRYDAGSVDTSKAGFYYVTYYATDKSGNTASARRKVEVLHDAADTQALVNQIASTQSSDPEALRDYVRNTIYYSSSWGGDDPVWYGFKEKNGNCYVHALCLNSLLRYHGYNTKLIWTTCRTHYWLLIELNGEWKHIDPTPSRLHGRYSLMSDDQRYETLKGRDWDRSAWPTCN